MSSEDIAAVVMLILTIVTIWALGDQWGMTASTAFAVVLGIGAAEALILQRITESTHTLRQANPWIVVAATVTALVIIAGFVAGIVAALLAWGILPALAMIALLLILGAAGASI